MDNNKVKIGNPHLEKSAVDNFHHLGFDTSNTNVAKEYSDIKFVCMSGSNNRVLKFARFIQATLRMNAEEDLQDRCLTDRYVMYKVGPVLTISHGMGVPSATILMHEIFKLLHYAGARDVVLFRMGTSGGLGLKPGSVVVTKQAVDAMLRPFHEQIVLGNAIQHPTELEPSVANELSSYFNDNELDFDVVQGNTMCCDDFYEGQGRLDGAFCDYTNDEKLEYLKKAFDAGVRNIEMESLVVASMCRRAGLKAAIVCVVLVNRLQEDQILLGKEELEEFQTRPWRLISHYIKQHLPGQ